MEIPWTAPATPEVPTGQDIVILGSRFELTSAWRSLPFLGHALRIWLQARRSPGIIGVSLRAHPLRATFWTLSAWSSQTALRDFARADPHRSIVTRVRPWAKTAVLRTWSEPGQATLDPAALWKQAEARISHLPHPGWRHYGSPTRSPGWPYTRPGAAQIATPRCPSSSTSSRMPARNTSNWASGPS